MKPSNTDMVIECLKSETNTDWEKEFLGSLKTTIDEGRSLSDKQVKILVRIFSKSLSSEEVARYKEVVVKCLEKKDLKEWDASFLKSISSVLEKGYTLSEKQASSLNKIHLAVYKSGSGGLSIREE